MFCESHFTSSNINCYSLLKRKQLIASSYWMFTVVKQLELFSHLHVHLIFWYQIHQILLNWKDHFIEAGMKICSFLEWLVWEKVLTDMYRMMIFRWLFYWKNYENPNFNESYSPRKCRYGGFERKCVETYHWKEIFFSCKTEFWLISKYWRYDR